MKTTLEAEAEMVQWGSDHSHSPSQVDGDSDGDEGGERSPSTWLWLLAVRPGPTEAKFLLRYSRPLK